MSDIFRDWSFGGQLREFRIKRKLTLRAAAQHLGADAANMSKLENNRFPPPASEERLRKLLEPLNPEKFEIEMLCTAAFNYHLGVLRERWAGK